MSFDEAFGTISFTATLRLDFQNPYNKTENKEVLTA
jgi:hypothetical protein